MREITADCGSVPQIGIRHENGRTVARISLKSIMDMVESHPGGSYTLAYRRRLDDQFYVSDDFTVADGYLEWTVGSHALAVAGDVTVQVSYATGSITAETPQMRFTVGKSIFNGENGQGENLSDLVEAAITAAGGISEALNEAREELDAKVTAAQTARGAAEAAQTAAENAQHTAENAKASAVMSSNAAYNYAADANRAKRDSVNAMNDAVQAKTDAENAQEAAETAEDNANTSALKSEGYAVGTQNGTPAGSGEPYYQDNAKYYKEQAAAAKTAAEAARDTAQQTVAGIEAAGTAQVGRVAAEGATQVGNVQTKGQQVLDSIPDDYSELSGEVIELKSAITNASDKILNNKLFLNFVQGKRIKTSVNPIDFSVIDDNNNSAYIVIDCVPDDIYTISGRSGNANYRLWSFCTSDGTILTQADSNITLDNVEIVAPATATKLLVNVTVTTSYFLYKGQSLGEKLEKLADDIGDLSDDINENTEKIDENSAEINVVKSILTGIETLQPTLLNGFFNSNTGAFTSNNEFYSYKIEVEQDEEYYLTGSVGQDGGLCLSLLLDNNNQIVRVIHKGNYSESQTITDEYLKIPQGVAYLTLTSNKSDLFALKKVAYYDIESINRDVNSFASFLPFKGKKIVNFGDSIIGNYSAPTDVSTYLANLTGATVYNCGFGGCRMGKHSDTHFDKFSMYQLVNAMVSDDWSAQDAAVAETGWGMPSYFPDHLAMLKAMDWSTVDMITIAYGTNDWTGLYLDKESDPYDTGRFAGALRYCIEALYQNFPHIKLCLWTPIYRFFLQGGEYTSDSDTENYVEQAVGYSLPDLVDKEIAVAKDYHVPCIDNYYNLGMNRYNRGFYFPANDGTHPNENGRKLIAQHVAKELF